MSGAPEDDDSGLEPFSPSVFLDLPPTPRPDNDDGDGEDDPAALPDDLVLPFIEHMLMEQDMDDKFFYQYPDHPALLQAQQPFADILSDASCSPTDSSSSGGGVSSNGTNGSGGTTSFTVSPSSSDDNAAFFSTGHDGGEASHQQQQRPETNTGAGQSRVDMQMLNQAFLKGVEEANKLLLLPTANSSSSILISGESNMNKVEAADGIIEALPFQGRGCKNRQTWGDDDGSEGWRSSKVVVPEEEETGDTVDKLVFNGYALCLHQMESLRIAMGTGTSTGKAKKTSASSEEAVVVDLSTSLIHCAEAVSMSDHRSAAELLRQIKRHASPRGDADQRLAYCFAEGLEARLAGAGSTLYRSLMVKRTSAVDFLRAYHLYLAATCFKISAFTFSNRAIRKAVAGKANKLHIVDYGVDYGCQWPNLLRDLAKRSSSKDDEGRAAPPPPEVRMTCVGVPEPGFRPAARIEETGRRLASFARRCGLPFTFRSVAARWETVRAADLDIRADEVLVVNSITQFQNLMDDDEGVDGVHSLSRSRSPPRDAVLNNIREMRPDVFVLSVANASHSAPFFISRFREALFYYSAMFDILDATAPRGDERRMVVERDLLGRCALNIVACEGADRVERPETYRQWQARCRRAGLRQLPLFPDVVKVLTERVRKQNHKDFFVDVDRQWLVQGWKGRILYAMSTWVADDPR